MTLWIILFERVACSVKLFQIEKNYFTVISDQITEEISSEITSFTFNSSSLQTLQVLSDNKFALSSYDLNTGDHMQSSVFEKQCDQALVFHTTSVICRAQQQIFLMKIQNNQLYIVAEIQANEGEIVATYQKEGGNNEIFLKHQGKIKCVRFDSLNCQTSFTEITQFINKNNNQGPIIIKENDESLITILKQNKQNGDVYNVPTTQINTLKEAITSHLHPRMLGNAPTFNSPIPGTLNIKLGSTYSLTFPTILDESASTVTVTVTYSTIPHMTKVSTQSYTFSPPLNGYSSILWWSSGRSPTYQMTIVLKDTESTPRSTTYYYYIQYTNTAPYFQTPPTTTSISMTATQQRVLQLSSFRDDEGHTVSLQTTLSTLSTSLQSQIVYDSAYNKFVVTPSTFCDQWTTSFQYWLTDQDLISTKYTLNVAVTPGGSPPDFVSNPGLQPVTTPYTLHVKQSLAQIK